MQSQTGDSVPLYICKINIKTLKITRYSLLVESDYDWDEDNPVTGFADYDDFSDGSIYAESLTSQAEADRLVKDKCWELSCRFKNGYITFVREEAKAYKETGE